MSAEACSCRERSEVLWSEVLARAREMEDLRHLIRRLAHALRARTVLCVCNSNRCEECRAEAELQAEADRLAPEGAA